MDIREEIKLASPILYSIVRDAVITSSTEFGWRVVDDPYRFDDESKLKTSDRSMHHDFKMYRWGFRALQVRVEGSKEGNDSFKLSYGVRKILFGNVRTSKAKYERYVQTLLRKLDVPSRQQDAKSLEALVPNTV